MTAAVATTPRITPEYLLSMPDAMAYELVDGKLVERNMGWESSLVAMRLAAPLAGHCAAQGLGHVAGADASYQCYPDAPTKVRRPDVSFVRLDPMPPQQIPRGHCRVAPDLVVEVVSPPDLFNDVIDKAEEYLGAGVRMVWVVSPPARRVFVYRRNGPLGFLGEQDELSGEDVVAGFRCRVADLFANPPPDRPSEE